MKLIDRHGPCVGLRLFKSKTRFIQLWFCPEYYVIEQHSHPDEHIELMYLFGSTTFYRLGGHIEWFTPKWYDMFKTFSVKPGVVHWFNVTNQPLVFINWSKFNPGKTPVSAAVDFKEI